MEWQQKVAQLFEEFSDKSLSQMQELTADFEATLDNKLDSIK